MSYSVKKAGVDFKIKVETSADLSGEAAGFSAFYINDADGSRTDVVGAFTEDTNAAGLYLSPAVNMSSAGDYTIIVNNGTIGMDNHPTPIVVTNASIDDVKSAVDALQTTADAIALDVDGLDGTDLSGIRSNLDAIKLLIDDQDGTAVNSVMEFVTQIDAAVAAGNTSLSALSGYTDDVENMLLGTEFLADGTTANPLFGANNAELKALIEANLAQLQGDMAAAQTSIENAINAAELAISTDVAAVKTVVDANSSVLVDAGYGLSALKTAIDSISSAVGSSETNLTALINDIDGDIVTLSTLVGTRFDSVDADLASIEGKIDAIGGAQGFRAFV